MTKQTSRKGIVLRSTLLLPLLALLLFAFSQTKLEQIPIENPSNIIKIEIKNENEIWFKDTPSKIEELADIILSYHNDEDVNKIEAQIYSNEMITSQLVDKITKELRKIGVKKVSVFSDRFSILETDYKDTIEITPQTVILKTNQLILRPADLNRYNSLAKKYNANPVEKRIIPLESLKILETLYSQMTDEQKQNAQAFPECLPKNKQNGASREQIAEYNKLTKHYNEMSSDHMRIIKKDVERLKYIYGIMSEKQKASAQPFPEFPEPPLPPKAPKVLKGEKSAMPPPPSPTVKKGDKSNIPPPPHTPKTPNTSDYAGTEIKRIIETQDTYDQNNLNLKSVNGIPVNTKTFYVDSDIENIDFKDQENMRVYIHNSSSSKTDNSSKLIENLRSLEKQDAQFYFDGKKITSKEGFHIVKNERNIKIETLPYSNKQPEVRIYKKDNDVRIPPPPAPPTPPSPLDYVIDAAKNGAAFMYEGENISSNQAIDLLKNNKELNIESRNKNGTQIIRITKDPVTID